MFYAADPGVHKGHGIAAFDENGELRMAFLMLRPSALVAAQILAVEIPVVRATGLQKGRQSDLIDLAFEAGRLAAMSWAGKVVLIKPENWKGQLPKDVAISRIKERLTNDELERVELPKAQYLQDNVWDAIGIGLHCFSKDRALMNRKRGPK